MRFWRTKIWFLAALIVAAILLAPLAHAGVEQISEGEFRALAAELAPKVNLFQAGWEADPSAEFYGGTTRDYLYWLKGAFRDAGDRAAAEKVIGELRARPLIDVREFIIGDSDVDVIAPKSLPLAAEDFGVRKIDFQSLDILDPKTELGANEILQGYIPAEKIRLNRQGLVAPDKLGDGVGEIYRGKLSVFFSKPEDFAQSKFAKEGLNHPILLALRYLRLQAINYYRTHGAGLPEAAKLHSGMDDASAAKVHAVIDETLRTPELTPLLERDKFRSWLNGGIQKAFRSYTNPTAALALLREFRVDGLPELYVGKVEPLNQYVFQKYRDEAAIVRAFADAGVKPETVLQPLSSYFPDGKIYHGTRDEAAFRAILFQGLLPSTGGSGGAGLYGVAETNKQFSEKWGGAKERLLSFPVKPEARLVDVTEGAGKRLWEATKSLHGGNYEKFADLFGVDIIRYPYTPQAFVVKNAAVLGPAEGVYRQVLPLPKLMEAAATLSKPEKVISLLSVNQVSKREAAAIWAASQVSEETMVKFLSHKKLPASSLELVVKNPYWNERPAIQALFLNWVENDLTGHGNWTLELLRSPQAFSEAQRRLFDGVFGTRSLSKQDAILSTLYRVATHSGLTLPNATSLALKTLEADALTGKTQAWDRVNYLRRAAYGPAEADRIFAILPKLPTVLDYLGPSLIHNKFYLDQVRRLGLDSLEKRVGVKARWNAAHYWAEELQGNPRLGDFILSLLDEDEHPQNLSEVRATIKFEPRARAHLLKNLQGREKQKTLAFNLLADEPLAAGEWARWLDAAEITGGQNVNIVNAKLRGFLPEKASREDLLALIRLGLRVDDTTTRGSLPLRVFELLRSFPSEHNATKRDYVHSLLANPAPVDPSPTWGKSKELRKIFDLMKVGAVPAEKEDWEVLLGFFERNAHPAGADWWFAPNAFIQMDLKDPGIAARVERLYLDGKIHVSWTNDLALVFDAIPNPSPEFRAFRQKIFDIATGSRVCSVKFADLFRKPKP